MNVILRAARIKNLTFGLTRMRILRNINLRKNNITTNKKWGWLFDPKILDRKFGVTLLWITILFALVAFVSCLDPYYVNLGGTQNSKIVVYGQITNQEGYQTIHISLSSTINEPKYKPLSNCSVQLVDTVGNVFILSEYLKGEYKVWMNKENLLPGCKYCVKIKTPENLEILSDYDKMPEGSIIDSIYYLRENRLTNNPNNSIEGIQLYTDFSLNNPNHYYYRFELIETWEHHSLYPKTYYWNEKTIIRINPTNYSEMICWTTQTVPYIYTLSTQDLEQKRSYKKFKLNFIDNSTQRLTYCYSVLVNQYSISKPAYQYWDKLRINNYENEGLYQQQPMPIKGNLKCVSNPDIEVLGFFNVSSCSSKRYFIQHVENLDILYPSCKRGLIDNVGILRYIGPTYLMYEDGFLYALDLCCVKCNCESGSTTKPSFWPY